MSHVVSGAGTQRCDAAASRCAHRGRPPSCDTLRLGRHSVVHQMEHSSSHVTETRHKVRRRRVVHDSPSSMGCACRGCPPLRDKEGGGGWMPPITRYPRAASRLMHDAMLPVCKNAGVMARVWCTIASDVFIYTHI